MGGKKILLVDDEEHIRKLLSTFLRRQGYEIMTANDGWEAREAVERDTPDLVITDVNMPRINGLDLMRWLRTHHTVGGIPVIILSADHEVSGRGGADAHLSKPVELTVLAAQIEELLVRDSRF